MTDTSGLSHLGGRQTEYRYENPTAEILESFAHPQTAGPWVVGLECAEFTSLCPITGQPDFGTILIDYVPDQLCVESKSLKLYLGSYRNHGSFHEACVNQIADDLVSAIAPSYMRVFGDFKPRGGICIRPMAIRYSATLTDLGRRERAQLLDDYNSARRSVRRHELSS